MEDATPLLILFGMTFVEDDAVAGLEEIGGMIFQADGDGVGREGDDGAGADAAGFGEAGGNEGLVVDAGQEAVGKTAGEGLGEIELLLAGNFKGAVLDGGVEGRAVGLRGGGDVMGAFQAAFDFERADATFDEVADQIMSRQILRREEIGFIAKIPFLAVDEEFIGKPAGLGALAAVGGSAAEGFGGQALAGIADAERAVDEDFDGNGRGDGDLLDIGRGEFARENDPGNAQPANEFHPARLGEGHLR